MAKDDANDSSSETPTERKGRAKKLKSTARKPKSSAKKRKADTKKGKAAKGARSEAPPYSSIATHPRARASVRRIKAWVGLAGFAIAALLSARASVPLIQIGERALIAGVVGYLVAWWISLLVWRQLMIAEQRAAVEEIKRRRAERSQQAASAKQG